MNSFSSQNTSKLGITLVPIIVFVGNHIFGTFDLEIDLLTLTMTLILTMTLDYKKVHKCFFPIKNTTK